MELEHLHDSVFGVNNGGDATVYISSTPEGRRLLTDPLLVGSRYQDVLGRAVTSALANVGDLGPAALADAPGMDVLYILRGGLSFGIQKAAEDLYRSSPMVSFVTSARSVSEQGPTVVADSYRRFVLQGNRPLLIGDISATGETILNVCRHLAAYLHEADISIPSIVIVTVATAQAVRRLTNEVGQSLNGAAGGAGGIDLTIIGLEGLFDLYTASPELPGHVLYTDFFPSGGLIAPPLVRAILDDPVVLLDRCVIYDGGARAFEPYDHLRSLQRYWQQLSDSINANGELVQTMLGAKLGLDAGVSFDDWPSGRCGSWREGLDDQAQLRDDALSVLRSLDSDWAQRVCDERLELIAHALQLGAGTEGSSGL